MSETLEDAPASTRPAEIRGLVDNATETKLYGWAWNAARPGERLEIELRVRDEPVARCVAEQERKDLAKAGIGDGCHAFELPLRPGWARRPNDLLVVARAADGTESALALRLPRAEMDPTGTLQRTLEATTTAHRQLREELDALSTRIPTEETMRDLADGQAALRERLDALSIWLTRLDSRLGTLPAAPAAAPRRRLDPWQVGLGVALAAVLAGAGFGIALLTLPA